MHCNTSISFNHVSNYLLDQLLGWCFSIESYGVLPGISLHFCHTRDELDPQKQSITS